MPASYNSSRLLFNAKYIEPLAWDHWFEVHTPLGVFHMTKRVFYDVLSNVV